MIRKVICITLNIFLTTAAFIMTMFIIDYCANHRIICIFPAVISSDSMSPALRTGDLIFLRTVENAGQITKGSIITYRTDDVFLTHRVLRVLNMGGNVSFETKGDANTVKDNLLVAKEDVAGVCCLRIPYMGYMVQFIKTPVGALLFIVLPAGMLIREKY